MTNEQLAIRCFEDGIKNTNSGNWIIYKDELEEWAGHEVDTKKVFKTEVALFGDFIFDYDTDQADAIDIMFGTYYCDFMDYREENGYELEDYAKAVHDEFCENIYLYEDPEGEWKHANEEYDRCQEYLAKIKELYKEA